MGLKPQSGPNSIATATVAWNCEHRTTALDPRQTQRQRLRSTARLPRCILISASLATHCFNTAQRNGSPQTVARHLRRANSISSRCGKAALMQGDLALHQGTRLRFACD